MGRDSRFRVFLNRRKRFNLENIAKFKILLISLSVMAVILIVSFAWYNINFNSTTIIPVADGKLNDEISQNLSSKSQVDIYGSPIYVASSEEFNSLIDDNAEEQKDNRVYLEDSVIKDEITFTAIGEIMMGAEVTENLDYHYSKAFKSISQYTRESDFTYGVLGTNIANVDTITNAKSKYIVTKSIRTAFSTLGVDALNIATDHITDYDKTIFASTVDILKNNNIYMAGINNSTLYLNICGKKVAIVATLSSYIGDKLSYEEFGINLYNHSKFVQDIADASDNADFVIADIAWGREENFGITNQMRNIAKIAIDSGADLVLGSNALGIYPIYTYKDVPIIYSTGYLITDSDLYLARRSYIWQFNINSENKVDKLVMIPVCTEDKTYTKDFRISSPDICNETNIMINEWNNENGIESTISKDGTIEVVFYK